MPFMALITASPVPAKDKVRVFSTIFANLSKSGPASSGTSTSNSKEVWEGTETVVLTIVTSTNPSSEELLEPEDPEEPEDPSDPEEPEDPSDPEEPEDSREPEPSIFATHSAASVEEKRLWRISQVDTGPQKESQ
jgi:hypothetical protein